jgi:hypothetical protein
VYAKVSNLPLPSNYPVLYKKRNETFVLNLGDDWSVLERRHNRLRGADISGSRVLRRKSSIDFFCWLRDIWGGEIGVGDIAGPDAGVAPVVLPDGKREEEDIGNHD